MFSSSVEQYVWPYSTSALVRSQAEYHSGYYTVSGHNTRYSAQMRRKRQCCSLPLWKQTGQHCTL